MNDVLQTAYYFAGCVSSPAGTIQLFDSTFENAPPCWLVIDKRGAKWRYHEISDPAAIDRYRQLGFVDA